MPFLSKPIPVLMYHQINRTHSPSSLVIPPESFSRQIEWLEKKKFLFLSLDEVVGRSDGISLWERVVALTFDDGFRDNYDHAFSLLRRKRRTAALFVVVNWVGQKGFMDWNEIHELAEAGFTIGSHSLTHRWLPEIRDEGELRGEIFDSKKKIEDHLGREVRHFCYPVGGVSRRVADLVKEAGYRAGWAAGGQPSPEVRDSRLALRRIRVSRSDSHLTSFAVKAYGLKGVWQRRSTFFKILDTL